MAEKRITLRLGEAADAIGVAPGTLRRWANAGRVPCVRVGRTRLFALGDLRAWLEANREGGQ